MLTVILCFFIKVVGTVRASPTRNTVRPMERFWVGESVGDRQHQGSRQAQCPGMAGLWVTTGAKTAVEARGRNRLEGQDDSLIGLCSHKWAAWHRSAMQIWTRGS